MIEMLYVDGVWAPVIVCDACRKPIRAPAGGAASVVSSGGVAVFRTDGRGLVRYAHKGACHNRVEQILGKDSNWEELSPHLIYLCSNTSLPVRELARLDKDFEPSPVRPQKPPRRAHRSAGEEARHEPATAR